MIIDMPAAGDIPSLRQLWKQAFGDPDTFLDSFFSVGFSMERCRCLRLDGKLTAALYWFDCNWQDKKVAYLYAVATDMAFRGKGLCRALMEDTHCHLQNSGYAGAALVPGDRDLFALYKKLGYRSFCPMQTVTVAAGTESVAAESLSHKDFDALRPSCLPKNAVLQEGAITAFLSAFAGLYKTETSVFAATKEGNALHFQEYLGDPALLGGIVAGLQAEKGIVRFPGGSADTAMYHSLDGSDELPAYLGIPLN